MAQPRDNERIAFIPHNARQSAIAKLWPHCDVMIIRGPAGSGKTHLAVALAALDLQSKKANRIILSRPTVTACGEEIGLLPGDVNEKMHPWLLPVHDVLRRMTFAKPDKWIAEHCEVCPLAFMRGRTFDDCVAILDEAQNATRAQLRLFLSRIGPGGKLVLTGDVEQCDIPNSGFLNLSLDLREAVIPGVAVVDLLADDNPRHHLISEVLAAC